MDLFERWDKQHQQTLPHLLMEWDVDRYYEHSRAPSVKREDLYKPTDEILGMSYPLFPIEEWDESMRHMKHRAISSVCFAGEQRRRGFMTKARGADYVWLKEQEVIRYGSTTRIEKAMCDAMDHWWLRHAAAYQQYKMEYGAEEKQFLPQPLASLSFSYVWEPNVVKEFVKTVLPEGTCNWILNFYVEYYFFQFLFHNS